jgi:hypothetical protein
VATGFANRPGFRSHPATATATTSSGQARNMMAGPFEFAANCVIRGLFAFSTFKFL